MSPCEVKKVESTPFKDQNPGTSGLRKKCSVFMQSGYTENFVQAVLESIPEEVRSSGTLVIGGDGRYYCLEATLIAIRMAAANKVRHVVVCQDGLGSTPAISNIIRKRSAIGGIILTASHNAGGPDGDFGIKYNTSNGGPAPESETNRIFAISKSIKCFLTCPHLEIFVKNTGIKSHSIRYGSSEWETEVEVIDSTQDYVEMVKKIFDFSRLKEFLGSQGHGSNGTFTVNIDGRNGVAGPYIRRIFIDELGAPEGSVSKATPLPDFGGKHPDPNLTYANDFVVAMESGSYDFGAAFDGDADRCMILGKDGFFVSPSDSVAVIAANAVECIPYFCKRGGLSGVARSMPTSAALDKVTEVMGRQGQPFQCYEVPTGWKFFGNLMDAGKICICGEESFGAGSDHIREKDGIWACLAWLSIVERKGTSVEAVLHNHWKNFGRHYYTRYDYEELTVEQGTCVMKHAKALVEDATLVGKSFTVKDENAQTAKGREYKVKHVDNFSYADPVDGSVTSDQGVRIIFTNEDRIVVRISGTGSSGSTIRLYLEHFENDKNKLLLPTATVMRPLVALALQVTNIKELTTRNEPTVIT